MAQWDDLLNKTMTVRRRAVAVGTRGAADQWSWSDHLVGVPVALQPLSASEREALARVSPRAVQYAWVNGLPDILARDRVVVDGDTYEIEAVEDVGGRGEMTRLLLTAYVES